MIFTVIDVKETKPKLFGPSELGPVRPSFRLSVLPSFYLSVPLFGSFLGIGSLVFSETQHVFRGLCVIVHDSGIFFFFKNLSSKWGKWAKNRVLGIY